MINEETTNAGEPKSVPSFQAPPNPGNVHYSDVELEGSLQNTPKDDLEDSETVKKLNDRADKFPMRQFSVNLGGTGTMSCNPLTSLIGIGLLWGISIYCMVEPDKAKADLTFWQGQTTLYFTWFYIGTQALFMFFIFFIAIRYGKVKLGKDDDEPEFSDVSYFAMLFSAGVAVGLFFFGVSEPLYYQSSTWYVNEGYHSQDAIDMMAMNQTFFHWGLAAWAPYLVVTVACALASYRYGLPLTFRSPFYPIFGEYTWGWIGDVIDGFTIVTVVAGVCTSLGLGAIQIVEGLQRVGAIDSDLTDDQRSSAQAITIWVVTGVATISVLSGLNVGIKYLSQFAFGLGLLLWFLVLVLDKTSYVLNLMVQSVGFYFQWSFFQINFWTDAFGQLRPGEGRAVDGKAAPEWFMNAWTIFYFAWWTAWSSFVGLFIARISKGRTVREVIGYSLLGPLVYAFAWFSVFGGIGLRQARLAKEIMNLGKVMHNDSEYYLDEGPCYNVPPEESYVLYPGTDEEIVLFTNYLPGISPVCKFDSNNPNSAWFNVLYSFYDYGGFLSVLSLIAIAIYFVTSSDSGSLIVDHLASNGHEEHHWIQRVFWAFTEGAVATALLLSGGSDSLRALQAASIVAGLPFTVFLCYLCQTIVQMCNAAEGDKMLKHSHTHAFAQPVYGGIFNVFEWVFSLGKIHPVLLQAGIDFPNSIQVLEFFKALFLPFVSFYSIQRNLNTKKRQLKTVILSTACLAVLYIAWIALFISSKWEPGIVAFAWSAFFAQACMITNVRYAVRERFLIKGNLVEDFFASLFLYPQALSQCVYQFELNPTRTQDEAEE